MAKGDAGDTAPMMRSVDRALFLLSYFTVENPEWGLSELARKAELDKATTLRILVALIRNRFVEQNATTKKYRLGIAVLRLARVREQSFPLIDLIMPALDRMAEAIEETAHASLASDDAMISVAVSEPRRATRVWVNPSQLLPFHATASGLAFLAFSEPEKRTQVLATESLQKFTENTLGAADLEAAVNRVHERGYAFSKGTFEAETASVAAPIFAADGRSFGSVAIAGVASRMDEQLIKKAATLVVTAAIDVSRAIGGEPHANLLRAQAILANS